jgi:hypothetical protein
VDDDDDMLRAQKLQALLDAEIQRTRKLQRLQACFMQRFKGRESLLMTADDGLQQKRAQQQYGWARNRKNQQWWRWRWNTLMEIKRPSSKLVEHGNAAQQQPQFLCKRAHLQFSFQDGSGTILAYPSLFPLSTS